MDINKAIADLKSDPEFRRNVGMMLIHNGTVRGWSRGDRSEVTAVEVKADHAKIDALCREYEQRPGIFKVLAQACEGKLYPGDDLLFIIVAGALREDVKPVLAEILDRIKDEAVTKSEVTV